MKDIYNVWSIDPVCSRLEDMKHYFNRIAVFKTREDSEKFIYMLDSLLRVKNRETEIPYFFIQKNADCMFVPSGPILRLDLISETQDACSSKIRSNNLLKEIVRIKFKNLKQVQDFPVKPICGPEAAVNAMEKALFEIMESFYKLKKTPDEERLEIESIIFSETIKKF